MTQPPSDADIKAGLASAGYICNDRIALTLFLARALEKPVLVEGPPGVGKTELARASAQYFGRDLIRLQCYEGLDEAKALYEWKYGKQLLYTQVLKDKLGELLRGTDNLAEAMERLYQVDDLFYSRRFLEPRPLLQALTAEQGTVLLIDEIDKADQEFESFLLEMLADYQVSIPELGTLQATTRPLVLLTSNNTRELSDALKRRCLHLFIPFPDAELERRILASRVPGIREQLRRQLVAFVQEVRTLDLKKQPAISETIDWARTLVLLHAEALAPELVTDTLNVLLKHEEDIRTVQDQLRQLFSRLFKG
ncbi:MAG: ATPase [Pseudomonadales bacterium]|nr:ATPase [Pseudomonadales bacterium]